MTCQHDYICPMKTEEDLCMCMYEYRVTVGTDSAVAVLVCKHSDL